MRESIALRPIGVVRNGVSDSSTVRWEEVVSRIEVEPELQAGLEGLEEFSHVVVVFAFHLRPPGAPKLQVHPERRADMPLVGVFATRSPHRPNPIGIATVELLRREGSTLVVRGLDAFDGTPVLDLKPYLVRGDLVSSIRVPAWIRRLWTLHDEERPLG